MSEHVLSDEELRIPEHPDRPAMGWMSIELDAIRRYGNAAYNLGIERGKAECEKYEDFLCGVVFRHDSKLSGE